MAPNSDRIVEMSKNLSSHSVLGDELGIRHDRMIQQQSGSFPIRFVCNKAQLNRESLASEHRVVQRDIICAVF